MIFQIHSFWKIFFRDFATAMRNTIEKPLDACRCPLSKSITDHLTNQWPDGWTGNIANRSRDSPIHI